MHDDVLTPWPDVFLCTLTQGPPQQVERISRLLVQVDIVPQELDIHLLTVLGQRRQGQLQKDYKFVPRGVCSAASGAKTQQ